MRFAKISEHMAQQIRHSMTRWAILMIVSFFLAACGKAGPPIKPSEAAAKRAAENGEPAPETEKEDRRIILDRLLD